MLLKVGLYHAYLRVAGAVVFELRVSVENYDLKMLRKVLQAIVSPLPDPKRGQL